MGHRNLISRDAVSYYWKCQLSTPYPNNSKTCKEQETVAWLLFECFCPLQNSCWNLSPSATVWGGVALEDWRRRAPPSWMRCGAPVQGLEEALHPCASPTSTMWRHRVLLPEDTLFKQPSWTKSQPNNEPAGTLMLDSPASRTIRKTIPVLCKLLSL